MESKPVKKRSVFLVLLCILISVGISVFFISQMNRTVENNTVNTIRELAEHDRLSIENFVETKWNQLYGITERFSSYNCDTILALQEHMNLECASCDFQTLYLIAEDGSVYTDRYMRYEKEQADILQYFGDNDERIVRRYDYALAGELQREMLLYAIRLDEFTVEGTRFVALAGLSNIKQIQDEIMISSFTKDGENRGYSSVVNLKGDYIVNVSRTASLNQRLNMYDMLSAGKVSSEWSNEAIAQKMENKETFYFYYTDKEGTEKLIYCEPIENTIWYFLLMVEKEVFTEQSRAFIFSSMAMLIVIIVVITLMLLYTMVSRSSAIRAKAEAKARTEFLSNMSHEIRTPLNGIIGLLYLMRTHMMERNMEQMAEWIDKAHDTAKYLLNLVSDILDMSKLQADKLDIVPVPFTLEEMIDSIWAMQHHNIVERGIEFILEKNISCPCIIGDETRIKQVLMNVVGNAAKFTPKGGTIRLSVNQEKAEGNRVTTKIICADTGIGMSPQFMETIWESFTQEHNKKSDGTRGTGLGMAISKGFMDAMGGEITVESEVGEGSTFTIILHSEIAESAADVSGENEMDTGEQSGILEAFGKLLVAEDNELNAEIMTEILMAEGFEVVLAENGQMAVEKFMESAPGEFGIILMDMQMPVMDGCEAARKIRELDRADAATIPIIACTANIFQEDKDRAMKSGMNDFLMKPIDVSLLMRTLKRYGKGDKA